MQATRTACVAVCAARAKEIVQAAHVDAALTMSDGALERLAAPLAIRRAAVQVRRHASSRSVGLSLHGVRPAMWDRLIARSAFALRLRDTCICGGFCESY